MKWLNGYRIRLMSTGFITALLLGGLGSVRGATITVGPGPDHDFNTIQAGIDTVVDGDTVLVAPGEYIITEPITFLGKAITVMSETGPDETTIRMGTPADPNRGSVVIFENNETAESVLEGFTVTRGTGCWLWVPGESQFIQFGGGILFNASSATVRNCVIVQNRVEGGGGGVLCAYPCSPILIDCIIAENTTEIGFGGGGMFVWSGSSPSLSNCIIRDNSAMSSVGLTGFGGGVAAWYGSVTMTDCAIMSNTAGLVAGGFYVGNGSATLTGCIIARNTTTGWGGGVVCSLYGGTDQPEGTSPTITNCTIWGNSAGEQGGGVGCYHGVSVTLTNNIIWANTAQRGCNISLVDRPVLSITYSDVAGGQAGVNVEGGTLNWGQGNIDADPLFADPDHGDLHLKSEAGRWDRTSQIWVRDDVSSPCIDAGDPNSPTAFEPYPNGCIINMGAYGGTAEASKSPSGLHAKYGGGTGEPNDPYLLYTDEHLNALGAEPNDYDKHFKLMADIDLSGYVYDRAVIAPDMNDDAGNPVLMFDFDCDFDGTRFTGVFDGNGHTISHLTIEGMSYLGLFGQTGSEASISNLGLEAVDVNGMGHHVGGIVGSNGDLGSRGGTITNSYSTGTVTGNQLVGGLVGWQGQFLFGQPARVADCFSNSTVTGCEYVGGLVGMNSDTGSISNSFSTGAVSGDDNVGGLVGGNGGSITMSIWDIETSGLTVSDGGVGLTTAEMMDPFVLGLNGFANDPNWILDAGRDYPRLAWEGTTGQIIPEPVIDWMVGQGTEEDPYHIDTADQLILLSRAGVLWDEHFILGADIDLDPNLPSRRVFSWALIQSFEGVFDGSGHVISHLTIVGDSYLGLFGRLGPGASISNLALESVNVNGTGSNVGGLVGCNNGSITASYSTGSVKGDYHVGGLVGYNEESITSCYSSGWVSGFWRVGGLVGFSYGNISNSYSTGNVNGNSSGGLVGYNGGSITMSVWDMETSGLVNMCGGQGNEATGCNDSYGKTTAEMQSATTFLDAGWDFVGETANGTEDIWWIDEGEDYPRLWWEAPTTDD